MRLDKRYKGIFYMILAALGFSTMGGAAKILRHEFNAGQLVFYRNVIGTIVLLAGFAIKPAAKKTGGRFFWLAFRGLMGTVALYTLLYCILHLPLGTAMTYNLTSAIFIALFSFIIFKEYHGPIVVLAVLIGFLGMLMVYKPAMHFAWYYHLAGLISGVSSAFAYITVGRLTAYYDTRIIVSSFFISGVVVPAVFMLLRLLLNRPADDVFFIDWQWPHGTQWLYLLWLGLAALFGQYFVTKAYAADKPSVVASVGYSNIIFSVFIGMMLGDAFPDWLSLLGIGCIILSGIAISFVKGKAVIEK